MRQPAPRNHEQRLEHIMKKTVMQEQVWGVGLAPGSQGPTCCSQKVVGGLGKEFLGASLALRH